MIVVFNFEKEKKHKNKMTEWDCRNEKLFN